MESFCPLASISALPSEHFLLPSTIPSWSDATVAAQAPTTLTGGAHVANCLPAASGGHCKAVLKEYRNGMSPPVDLGFNPA